MRHFKSLKLYNHELRSINDGLGDAIAEFEYIEGILDEETAYRVVNYMESGFVLEQWLSSIIDDRNTKLRYENKFVTDGEYVWHDEIRHNIKYYRIQVPNEFLNKVFEVNGKVNMEEAQRAGIDYKNKNAKAYPIYIAKDGHSTLTGIPYDEQR